MKWLLRVVLIFAIAGGFVTSALAAERELIGAGATFPYPLYSKMFDVYAKEYNVKVNYQAIGSGGGIRQLINKTVDFGASDAMLTNEDTKAAGAAVLHIPTCAGAVVITYNLPNSPEIRFTPDVVADIFLGKIKKWDDQRILAANPGVAVPSMSLWNGRDAGNTGCNSNYACVRQRSGRQQREPV